MLVIITRVLTLLTAPSQTTQMISFIPPSQTPELIRLPETVPNTNIRDVNRAGVIVSSGDLPSPVLPGLPSNPLSPGGAGVIRQTG